MKSIREICEDWFYNEDVGTDDLSIGDLIESLESREQALTHVKQSEFQALKKSGQLCGGREAH